MPGRYSLTVQVDPSLPGHVAVVVNTPSGQTYAGFGPRKDGRPISAGQLDVHTVPPDAFPPPDYSNVLDGSRYRTFTTPLGRLQAEAALAEIDRIDRSGVGYNVVAGDFCSTVANQIMRAAGLGSNLYALPRVNYEYLSDVADTLAADPKAKVIIGRGVPIPEELRGVQPDYAYVGGGYDTPSERTLRLLSRRKSDSAPDIGDPTISRELEAGSTIPWSDTSGAESPFSGRSVFPDGRFGSWVSSPEGSVPRNPNLPPPAESGVTPGIVTGKPMPLWITPPPIFDFPDRPGVFDLVQRPPGRQR